MGVAVQSHFLAVGRHVPWGIPGVGVVASQASSDPRYGIEGLSLIGGGASPQAALAACLSADSNMSSRQVAICDRAGIIAAHTGDACIQHAGHRVGANVSAQANMVASPNLPAAMVSAFGDAPGRFAGRLMAALRAAEGEGGDLRGRQSAAILVVSGAAPESPGAGVLIDLRVDDHGDPVTELERLVELEYAFEPVWRAMRGAAVRGPRPADPDTLRDALGTFTTAQATYGSANLEPTFWRAVALARSGRAGEARRLVEHLARDRPGWGVLFDHIAAAGWLTPNP